MVAVYAQHRLAEAAMVKWQDLAKETFFSTSHGSGPEVRATAQDLLPRRHTPRVRGGPCQSGRDVSLVGAGFGLPCWCSLPPADLIMASCSGPSATRPARSLSRLRRIGTPSPATRFCVGSSR